MAVMDGEANGAKEIEMGRLMCIDHWQDSVQHRCAFPHEFVRFLNERLDREDLHIVSRMKGEAKDRFGFIICAILRFCLYRNIRPSDGHG